MIELVYHKEDPRNARLALIATLVIFPVLMLTSLPSSKRFTGVEARPKQIIHVARWVPPPPPKVTRPRQIEQKELAVRRVPVPDPTPEDPEPIHEPDIELQPIPIPPDVEIVIGAIEAPPGSGPVRAGIGGATNPVVIESTKVVPTYPEIARRAKITGTVILEAVVLRDGTVSDIKVLRTPVSGLGFESAAIEAVRQWRFRPATKNGTAVDVYFTVVVGFTLT